MKAAYRLLEVSARLRRQKKDYTRLFVKNIMLLIELETIAADPASDKAKEIIARYRLKLDRRKEIEQAGQN